MLHLTNVGSFTQDDPNMTASNIASISTSPECLRFCLKWVGQPANLICLMIEAGSNMNTSRSSVDIAVCRSVREWKALRQLCGV